MSRDNLIINHRTCDIDRCTAKGESNPLRLKGRNRLIELSTPCTSPIGIGVWKAKKVYWLLSFFVVLVVLAAVTAGPVMSNVEQPQYTTVDSEGSIEIREYGPMIEAEVDVKGERSAAIREGFRSIAAYIFGDNKPRVKIEMTAPVSNSHR